MNLKLTRVTIDLVKWIPLLLEEFNIIYITEHKLMKGYLILLHGYLTLTKAV